MSDTSLLSGRLMVRSLPSVSPRDRPDMPVLKRLALPQGGLAQFHDSDVPIHYIAALELIRGSVRGNHSHRVKEEHVYVMQGELELIAQELESGERAQVRISTGDLAIIQPGVAHAFRVIQEGTAIEFAPTRFDPSDVYRHELI